VKRSDIRAGTVYAVVSYGRPNPLVFLEDKAERVWTEPWNLVRNGPYTASPNTKPHRDAHGRDSGYAAVSGDSGQLRDLDCKAELARFAGGQEPSREGLKFTLVFSLANIPGTYDEALAAWRKSLADSKTAREKQQAEAREHDRRLKAVTAGLAELDIRASSTVAAYGPNLVGLDIDSAEKLLAMLQARG